MNNDFLIEEYKNKWEYVRHTEEMENKSIQWFLAIVGAVISFLFKDGNGLVQTRGAALYLVPLFFLVIYSLFLNLLLLFQKRNYKKYTDRLQDLEKTYCKFETKKSSSSRLLTVFRLRYFLVTLVGACCAFLGHYQWSGSFIWSAVFSVSYAAIFIVLSYLKHFAH